MIADRIEEALAGTAPIVVVGPAATSRLWEQACAMGYRLASISASDLQQLGSGPWTKSSRCHWLVVIEGCETASSDVPSMDDMSREDQILEIAFDGHPDLPRNALVALAFTEPSQLSDSLADDEIPCAFIAEDAAPDENDAATIAYVELQQPSHSVGRHQAMRIAA